MIPFVVLVAIILFLGHAVAYKGFVSIFTSFTAQHAVGVRIAFLILMFSFLIASALTHNYDSIATRIFYTSSAVWLGFLLYFFLAAIVYGIIWMLMHFIKVRIYHSYLLIYLLSSILSDAPETHLLRLDKIFPSFF